MTGGVLEVVIVPSRIARRRADGLEGTAVADQITVSVDPDVADVYRSASDDERRKLDLLINLRLRNATESKTPLRTIMEEISREAQRRGLTPEILQSILGTKTGGTRSPFDVPEADTRATLGDVTPREGMTDA